MPSLAYASNEASGGSQGTESQEILLSRSDSSTSVNKTPDEPKAPPAYTAQDAYKSTPQSTGSGVDVVNGAGDSSDKSYTPGDDKSSINDKDSDSDSDSASNSGTNGTEDTDDSTSNEGQDPSDPKDNDDSTDKNNGAISDSTDEIATDKNQSAHPTGDDSKADDVIATPGDKGSADQNAGATSVKTEEVKQQTSISSQGNITTQASGKVTVHFGAGWTPNVVTSMSNTPQASDIYTNFRDKQVWGNASDPVFNSNGDRLFYGGTAITAGSTISINASEAAGLLISDPAKLFGYAGTQWLFIVKQDTVNGTTGATTTRYRKVPGTFATVINDRSYQNGFWTTIDAYPIYETKPISISMYYDNAEQGSFGGYVNQNVVTIAHSNPSNSKLVWTISPDSEYHPEAITQKKYYTDAEFAAGVTIGDLLNKYYNYRALTGSMLTMTQMCSVSGTTATINGFCLIEGELVDEDAITVTYDGNKPAAATGTVSGVPANGSGSKDGNTPFTVSSDIPTLAGYKFNGWNTQANGGGTSYAAGATIPGASITGNITLYAQWIQQLSITFNANGTGVTGLPSTITVDYNAATSIPSSAPTRANFTFKGWNTAANGSGTAYTAGQSIAHLTVNLPLYAQWEAYPVVTYNANSGTGAPSADTVAPGVYNIKTGTPTRTGYVFGGWTPTQNSTANGLYSYNATISGSQRSMNVTSNVTLYALWNPVVTYSTGTLPAGAKDTIANMPSTTTYTVTYNGTHTVLTTPTPTLSGYTFGGWAKSTAATTKVTSLTNVTAPITLVPIWTEKSGYTVQFFDQATATTDGTAYNTQNNLKWTGAVTVPTAPTKVGYTFGGWYLQKDNQGSGTGTVFASASGVIATGLNTFNGIWAAEAAGNRADTLKIYAKWTEKTKVSVTLNPNGGSYGTAGTGVTTIGNILNGATYTIPTNVDNPTRPGYNFKEWNTNSSGTGTAYHAGNTTPALTSNLVLYAIWTGAPVTFTFEPGATTGITYKKGSAANPYTATANYGAKLTADAGDTVYTRTGYTFKNWSYTNATGGTGTVSTATASGQVDVSNFTISWSGNSFDGTLKGTATLTAMWDPFTFKISWNGNGGTPTTSTSGHKSTDMVSIPTATSSIPTRPGYTFTGWNTAANGSGKVVDNSKTIENTWTLAGLANNATLTAYAQWKENIVELTFVGHKDKNNAITANVAYNDNNGAVPTTIYVGAATGAIYSSSTATTPTAFNISRKVKPSIVNTNFDFLKWQKNGTDLPAANYTSAGVLTVPTNAQGLYETATYNLIMGPKQYGYTVEYYLQDITGSGYTKDATLTVTSGTAPFGYRVESGTSASVNDTSSLVTFVRKTLTGFTYNAGVTGTNGFIVSIGSNPSANLIKLYYSRNSANLNISYVGAVPPGVTYTPATQSVRYNTQVTLTTPTAPTGYKFTGWTVASGSLQSGENLNIPTGGNASFHMPDNALIIRGNWEKERYTAVFKLSNAADGSVVGSMSGTSTFTVSYGDTIATAPTAAPNDSKKYYFIGWNVYTGCTGSNENTGTLVGTKQNSEINGTFPINSNTVFVGRFGELIAVSYLPGANGAFTEVNGNMAGGTVTNAGTVYENLQQTWNLPGFAHGNGYTNTSSFENPNTGRNTGNPAANPGWKFVGWSWVDGAGVARQNTGHYVNYVFVKDSGNDMPTLCDTSYKFTALWEKTWQQVHFSDQCANIAGVTGTGATDLKQQVGDRVTLPMTYHDVDNKGAYTFLGWTTVGTGYVAGTSPLYTNAAGHAFTMTAGTQNDAIYKDFAEVVADGHYGVTLYPVFQENKATINYTFATGCGSMGTVTPGSESINMASGTAAGATATAATGHVFRGWFKDAAGTQAVDSSWLSGTNSNVIKPLKVDGIYAAGPVTYYALFEVEKYTVTFDIGDTTMGGWADGSTNVTKQTANPIPYNTALGAANVPGVKGKTGYGFVAWNTKADGTGTSYTDLSTYKVMGPDVIFYAQWEPRDGYTIHYNPNGGNLTTVTQTTVSGGAKLKWTDVVNTVMLSDAKNMKKLGYTFEGWFTAADFSGTRIDVAGSTTTFGQAVMAQQPGITEDDVPTLELYAKWVAKDYTVTYNAQLPTGSITIGNKTPVHWDSTNLRPAGNETLSADGYDFLGWNTKANGSGMTVTDATVFSAAYQNVNGTTTDTVTTLTLYGIWKEKIFTVVFRDGANELSKRENLKWADTIAYYNPVTPNGPKRLVGWDYTPQGGTKTTWTGAPNPIALATIAGNATVAAGSTFYLDAVYEDNATWTINYNKVNVDAAGNPISTSVTKVGTEDGYIEPGNAIDIHSFNGKNYIKTFNDANAATTLKGYALGDESVLDAKFTATVVEVASGANIVFNVYWVEKIFNFEYDLGVDGQGNPAPSSLTPPAPRQAGWTNAVPQPTWPGEIPTWDGHKNPKWQYKNGSNWVDVPAGATVSSIAATDDNTNPIVLRLLWATDTARITYAAQEGGSAAGGALTVPAKGSASEDINAVSGTPTAMTATAASGYKFDGWYNGGTLITNNATLTVTKNPTSGLFETATYTAHFSKLGDIAYVIEHYFEQADGSYAINNGLTGSGSGQEGSRVDKTSAMEQDVKGYSYKAGITGEKLFIASLQPGSADNVLRLYYTLNENAVDVAGTAPGADAPATVPVPTYPSTGITGAHTNHKYGTTLVLPDMPNVSGWDFSWTITSTDPDFVTRTGVANGATFTMPDGAVSITGVWKRALHEVQFVAGADPHGTVSVKAPATLPFYVEHGKKMTEPGSTGHYGLIEFTEDTGWALAGWRYLDPTDGQTKDTTDPNSVVINANTVFTAIWAQTFYVAYDPGSGPNNHGGTGFTTLQRGGTDIGLGVNVSTLPLIIGGADRTQNAPAADGYKFIGWTWKNGGDFYWLTADATAAGYDTTGLGTAAQMNFTVERNITFTAIWEAIEQTLTYKIDGDNSPASNWTNMGKPGQAGLTTEDYVVNPKPRTDEVVTLLTGGDVERTGYTLAGWKYTDKDGITHTINGSFTMPAYAVTLTPVWDFAGLKIYFDYANGCDNTYGGLDKFSVNIDAGNASAMHIDGATASAYTGYKFMGWYEDADHTIKVDGYAVDGNHFIGDGTNGWTPKTYYAWFDVSETTYVIEFNLQTTTGFNTFERTFTGVTTGSTVDVEAAGNKAYADRLSVEAESAFASYVFDPTHANSELVKVVMADGTTKLILFYNMLPFDITYDKDLPDAAYTWDWVSEAGPNKGTAEKTITIPSAKRDGYQFAGWTITYVDPVSGETVTTDLAGNTFIMPMAPVLVTAKWAQYMDVVIEYFKRGDVDPLGTETDRAIEGTTYTVSLDQIAAFKAAHMSELNGYRYIDDGKRGVVITSDPRHNVIQIFFDLINDFGVQFDKNYGDNRIIGKVEGMSLADMPYGSRPADPKRAGWVLDADKTWNTKADGTGLQLKITTTLDELLKAVYGDDYNADDFLKAGGILTLYAIWNQNDQFEVIYDMNNMKEKNPNILNDMPEWREDMAAEDKKGALWDQAGFNFKPIDKELSAPHGYEFVGWNTKADGTGHTITDATKYFEMSNWIDPNVEQMSITLYAMWKEIELDIEYLHTVGGTVDRVLDRISAVTGQHVQTGSSPINPTERLHSVATAEAGYHFVRWELYDENKHAGLLRAMADGDSMTNILRFLRNDDEEIVVDPNEGRYYGARYIAIFEKNADATLVYDINGGTLGEIDSVTISHGLTTKLHNGVYVASTGKGYKRPYYTLVGWSTKPGEDNQVEYRLGQDYVMPEGGLTLYAVWQINSFPVDVDHRDDDLGKVDGGHADVVYGEKLSPEFIQSISQQPKNNSTFKGWHVTMTDSETGEIVFDQWVTDLSTLPDLLGPVVGPVSIAADYEAVPVEDLVTEGTTLPKTGDNGVLGWIIALVAGFALALIVLFARRRQDDDDDDDDELRARRASAPAVPAYAETIACAAADLRSNAARIARNAQSAAPTMLTLRKRNGRTRNTTHADGIAGTAISPATSFADSSLDSRNSSFSCVWSNKALAEARPVAFVRGAALSLLAVVLGCVVLFAPGIALATTGDPGTGSTSTASSHIQTNHSNTDPATSQTGSFQSKSVKAASASASSAKSSTAATKSSANSASAPSSSASAGCRASKNTSAAPSKAAGSGSGSTLAASSASSAGGSSATAASGSTASESYSTRIATSDNIKRLAYLNALANRTSTYRASATAATASGTSASTGAAVRTVGVSGVTSPSATGSAAAASVESAGIEGAGASSAVPGGLPAASDDTLAALGSVLSLKSSSDDSFAHTAAMFALRSTDQAQNDPNPNDGSGSGAATGDVFDVPRSRASATDSDDAVINDPGEPPGKTDDSTIIYPDDPDPQPGDEPGGSSADPGTDPVVPDEGDGVVDDPTDDPAGERPDDPSDANDPADEPADDPTDNPADDATDAPVKIVYKAGEGGTVSYSSDKICSSTGTKLDENGKPTDKELVGPVAAPKVGYHFVGWAIDDPNVDSVDDLVMVTSDAALDAKTVKGCAFSDKANCYKAASFIALFKCNDYVFNYDANGGQLNTAGVQIEPTQATFGSNALFSTAASPARDGYKFLCWNTAASGLGAAIREGDALSAEKMRGMVIEAPVEDENGAAIQLYAQWTPVPAEPTPIDPSELERPTQPVKPVVPTTPVSPGTNSNTSAGSNVDTNASAGASAGASQLSRLVNTATADESASEEALTETPLLVEDGALAALFAGIGAIGDAVVVPPALEVLPAATEEFVTRSAEAISGVPGTGNGQDASVGAVQAVGVATAAAGAIAIVLGVASAVSSTVARRRVVRALGADAAGGSGVEPSEPAGKAD
jgi:uncharacterized repeat protein (TIGR02543 family)